MEAGLGIIGRIHTLAKHRTRYIYFGGTDDLMGDSGKGSALDPQPHMRVRPDIPCPTADRAGTRDRDVRRFGSSGNSLPGVFITSDLIAAQALRRRQERGYPRRYRRCL